MSAEAPLHQATFAVGKYRCTLAVPAVATGLVRSMVVEWEPEVPRRLSPEELEAYRRGRDSFIAEVAAKLGVSAAVLEV